VEASEMQVVLNEDNFLPTNETIDALDKYAVSRIIVHSNYSESTRRHDIALVRLEEPLNFFEKLLNPVCLPVKNDVYWKKYNGTITKWAPLETLDGKTKFGDPITYQSKLTLPLISNQQCNTETSHKGKISEDML
jgi:secreted trypsin-like serine protease